jgi:hypothetical protein
MSENTQFKTWAIVELMGHTVLAGYVSEETIAGNAMLRIDVPQVKHQDAFTKFVSPGALYGISPCSEETAKARAESLRATPFSAWDVRSQILQSLKSEGRLLENKPESQPEDSDYSHEE